MCVGVCLLVCVCVRERKTERERMSALVSAGTLFKAPLSPRPLRGCIYSSEEKMTHGTNKTR